MLLTLRIVLVMHYCTWNAGRYMLICLRGLVARCVPNYDVNMQPTAPLRFVSNGKVPYVPRSLGPGKKAQNRYHIACHLAMTCLLNSSGACFHDLLHQLVRKVSTLVYSYARWTRVSFMVMVMKVWGIPFRLVSASRSASAGTKKRGLCSMRGLTYVCT
jgi:hypothetical protein